MKAFNFTTIALLAILLSGCLIVRGNSFSFDYDTGIVEVVYHDFRSAKGMDEDDYSIEKDWLSLVESLEESNEGKSEESKVHTILNQELFKEDDILSGKLKTQVNCPACFPSKQTLLEYLHKDGLFFEDIKEGRFVTENSEILFLIPSGTEVISTNGKKIITENNEIIVWPASQTIFKYKIHSTSKPSGKSLLPFFLKEQKKQKAVASN